MSKLATWTGFFVAIALLASSFAHEGHDHDDSKPQKEDAIIRHPGMILPDTGGKVPWSDKPVLNDPQRFQIAIVTDHTGGHRPGVWMHAVRNLNLLRPEFVVSVGDLIEGYTTDVEVIETQWKEFLGFIDQMEMKFFFVSGNHDVTNPVMHKIWREHFGKAWYSFDYKNVHFLCLCSEDPESCIGAEQLEWIKKDLHDHRDARWTLVFLHKPLWAYAETELTAGNPDPTNWKVIERLLANRPHNVFAGHAHNYVQFSRNETKYYQLATTGGASQLRGPKYGEFDHVAWLTMENDGPHLANILLDGVLPPDVVTEEKITQLRNLLAKTELQVAPILVRNQEGLSQGELVVRVKNGFETPINVSAKISGFPLIAEGRVQEAAKFSVQSQAGSEYRVAFRFAEPMQLNHFAQTTLTATITSQEVPPTVAEITVPVIIDELFVTPRAPTEIRLDGMLVEWPVARLATRQEPIRLGTTENWQGPDDCSLKFDSAFDDRFLYLYGTVNDDRLVRGKDALVIRLDPRSPNARAEQTRPGRGLFEFQCLTRPDREEFGVGVNSHGAERPTGEIRSAFHPKDDGYDFEMAIPLSFLDTELKKTERDYQMTFAILDVDSPNESPVYVIWRGTPEILESNIGLGTFVIER